MNEWTHFGRHLPDRTQDLGPTKGGIRGLLDRFQRHKATCEGGDFRRLGETHDSFNLMIVCLERSEPVLKDLFMDSENDEKEPVFLEKTKSCTKMEGYVYPV
jgi:hypothetical protein